VTSDGERREKKKGAETKPRGGGGQKAKEEESISGGCAKTVKNAKEKEGMSVLWGSGMTSRQEGGWAHARITASKRQRDLPRRLVKVFQVIE